MQLDDIAVFVRVVQAGSFTKAAASLGVTKSTVSARIAALEAALGVALLRRTTRAMSLTNDGEAFFAASAGALDTLEAAAAEASQGRDELTGVLRVTAPTALGAHLLPPVVAAFLAKHPAVQLKLTLTNRFVDLVGEGIDVAIRAGALKDSSLVQRKIGTSHFCLFASPAYLERHRRPKHPEALASHVRLAFASQGETWKLTRGDETATIGGAAPLVADDLDALTSLAVAGVGIALVPEFVARGAVRRKQLVHVLPGWTAHATGVYLVLPGRRSLPPRVRAFAELAAERLGRDFSAL